MYFSVLNCLLRKLFHKKKNREVTITAFNTYYYRRKFKCTHKVSLQSVEIFYSNSLYANVHHNNN